MCAYIIVSIIVLVLKNGGSYNNSRETKSFMFVIYFDQSIKELLSKI